MGLACELYATVFKTYRLAYAHSLDHVIMEQPTNTKIIELVKKKRHMQLLEKATRGHINSREIKELAAYESAREAPQPVESQSSLYIVKKQKDIADFFDVALRTIKYWKQEGMPMLPDGQYDLRAVFRWWRKREEEIRNNEKQSIWDERYREMKARKEELTYKKLSGELIPAAEVEKGRIQRVIAWKRAMQQLPRTIAPLCAGLPARAIEGVAIEHVNIILDTFSGVNYGDRSKNTTRRRRTLDKRRT